MALLESLDLPLRTKIVPFTLNDPFGVPHDNAKEKGTNGLLVAFTCNHCPYAVAVWPRLLKLARYARSLGINTIAINPNINPSYPDDSPAMMKTKIAEWKIDFPYLVDDTQKVADAYKAQCTPDIFLFDKNETLFYHGRIDDNWQDESKVTRRELHEALTLCAEGKPSPAKQFPSMGCSIKWLK
jgi:hypothetical protein